MTTNQFSQFSLNTQLFSALSFMGIRFPTPVQLKAIPTALQGSDLTVCAQTGSGKTLAFLIPTLNGIMTRRSQEKGNGPRILILAPTRELVKQIEKNVAILTKKIKWFRYTTLIGGTPYRKQIESLSKPLDLLIATPGRLIDLMNQGHIQFNRVEYLALDEADRMLDMGFLKDIQKISQQLPNSRQTLLFSATLDKNTKKLAEQITHNALHIEVERSINMGNISELLYYTNNLKHKIQILEYLLMDPAIYQAVIFTATKHLSEDLAKNLAQKKHKVLCLNGDMAQNQRIQAIKKLQRKQIDYLIATDVAARGIDIATITHVINFDLPKQPEDYIHRIGRTGRAGKDGIAITFAMVDETPQVHKIEKLIQHPIKVVSIEGMEPVRNPNKSDFKKARHNFKKRSGNRTEPPNTLNRKTAATKKNTFKVRNTTN
ncbi:MAG: DEAD/DEAH box helicase [Neisseriaceae bacterium]|nr:MAG: DEAD/DEAH box helicase [Neisseriaceae bacterium]